MKSLKATEEWHPSIAKSTFSLQDITLSNDKSFSFPTNLSALAALFPVLRDAFDSDTSVIIFCDTDDRTLAMLDDFVHTGKVEVGAYAINAEDLKRILQNLGLSDSHLTMETVENTESEDPLDVNDETITDDHLPTDDSDIAVKDEPNINEYLSMELHEEEADPPEEPPKAKRSRRGTGNRRGRPRRADRPVPQTFTSKPPHQSVPVVPSPPGQFRTILPRPVVVGHLVQFGAGLPPGQGFLTPGKLPLPPVEKPQAAPADTRKGLRKGRQKKTVVNACDLCGEEFEDEAGVVEHVQSLHGFAFCTECGHSFKNLKLLDQHKDKVHGHKCKVCGIVFKNNTALEKHFHAEHRNFAVRPFNCEVCGKGFLRKISKEQHMAIHENLRAHRCTVCSYSCNSGSNLSIHYQERHGLQKKMSFMNL